MAAMAANITGTQANTAVVPARGGLGDNVELQANTIATVLAQRLGASYRQLYVPDSVSEDILNSILKEDIGRERTGELLCTLGVSAALATGTLETVSPNFPVKPSIFNKAKNSEALRLFFLIH